MARGVFIKSFSSKHRDTPVVREFALPNGGKIVSLRQDTFRAALGAANRALKAARKESALQREPAKRA